MQGNVADAMILMRELLDTYPRSPYVERAAALLAKYGNTLDWAMVEQAPLRNEAPFTA